MNKREWQPLTISRVAWNQKTLTDTFGELIAEPLDPGFGITIGNALRRVLLSSVEGAAVTSIIIKQVNNEFSVLPGVVEDAMHVILNIKDIVIRNTTGQPGKMRMVVEGERVARVGDITADPHLELVNKDHIIAHVAAGGTLDIEFFVECGRGYRLAQWPDGVALQKDERIYVDAMFSPVRRVTFDVKKTRVGKDIDYDQLILAVTTNGAEKPMAAVHYAVSLLRTQLEQFLTDQEIPFSNIADGGAGVITAESSRSAAASDGVSPYQNLPVELLFSTIDALEFSVRANNCLVNAGVKRIIDLVNLTEDEVLNIKNFGRRSFEEVKEGMKAFGLSFDMKINEENLKKFMRSKKESV